VSILGGGRAALAATGAAIVRCLSELKETDITKDRRNSVQYHIMLGVVMLISIAYQHKRKEWERGGASFSAYLLFSCCSRRYEQFNNG
jgi:hypothetical protein